MSLSAIIHSAEYRALRATLKAEWRARNAACGICGQATIEYDGAKNEPDSFELDHKISRKRCIAMGFPELILDPSNCQPSHCRCNRSKQDGDARPPSERPRRIGDHAQDHTQGRPSQGQDRPRPRDTDELHHPRRARPI
ncbi:HNH endonuclease [Microbacterium sp. NIBRBAC000506063]|nr:HNH endonuclease [Microbacterium sp. NIBRBAC000506063]